MESKKLFSDKETLIWCICIALAGFTIIGVYMAATSKSVLDADFKDAHQLESHSRRQ
ncbi:hypothetical protein [Brevundimonas sp.]|uniref:hypothetical protein n=1 Tax=Brevundimonas sp. TaxID=1871086 RepID=UPI00289BFFE5|nr:hypothetical protein [Brevundimonas sp.]